MKRVLYLYTFLVLICLKGVECLTNLQISTVGHAVLGLSDLELRCSYNPETGDDIYSIDISAELNGQYRTIVAFYPENRRKDGTLRMDGNYLNGRVTMNNPKQSSNVAVLIFNQTECIDETMYKCKVTYDSNIGTQFRESNATAIYVEARPTFPDSVPSYIPSAGIEEGMSVVFTCTGNVGKPMGTFRWIVYRRNANGISIQESLYDNVTTTGFETPGTCTFNGTSQLTLQVESLDNNAVVRCQVVYQDVPHGNLYKQTNMINVYYSVRNVTVTKSHLHYTFGPGQTTLTCTSDGNPAVRNEDYKWYKMSQQYTVIGTGSQLITNATVGESDVYICVAQNSYNGKTFSSNSSIQIKIGKILNS
ncbi:Hypothetical predicted protein [Mytilus galloprovincialis]|uniref:Ig-like domain-containing protein n=1 Tax=Mytilus galloprovincialis TaxID=29158 RepID=A0A8B6GK48_MYTGA|nr:Hypothetical predicted protein [Mytilus galloprovincialis]